MRQLLSHWLLRTCFLRFLCGAWVIFLISVPTQSYAQLGGLETYKNRKLGSEPKAIEAILSKDLDRLKSLGLSNRQLLQKRGRNNRSTLMIAAMVGDPSILEFLLQNSPSIEAQDDAGNTALHYASLQGHEHIVIQLLANGANPNSINYNGEVALFLAIRNNHIPTIEALLDGGTDTSITDFTARSLQDYARISKNRRLKRFLKKRGLL